MSEEVVQAQIKHRKKKEKHVAVATRDRKDGGRLPEIVLNWEYLDSSSMSLRPGLAYSLEAKNGSCGPVMSEFTH